MHDADEIDHDARCPDRVSAFSGLEKDELEQQAIATIRELRLMVATADILYEEWVKAEEDPASPATVIRAMQADYLQRQRALGEKRTTLSAMLDVLGYIPEVPD
ncbi:Transcriptional repressor TraM [Rhizobium sp. NFR07]|uniref:transcriptional repressor TraM n=1 Tax=Rhizobium sp. NFR07 TaxID=1566262 RepID=UPI0008F178DF|nr:transcriptional repressor TraM [Rhizobium sp. NFR07]SFB63596.1 Transcriptional repressor TraM [Rhizobium sp. NFR07]